MRVSKPICFVRFVRFPVSIFLALFALSFASSAQQTGRTNPYEIRIRQHVNELRSADPLANLLAFEKIADLSDAISIENSIAILKSIAGDSRITPHIRHSANQLLVFLLFEQGKNPEATALLDNQQFKNDFAIIGPFDNDGKRGFETPYPPETFIGQAPDHTQSYPGVDRPVSWRNFPTEVNQNGSLSLHAVLRPTQNVCAYAEAFVHTETPTHGLLTTGAAGAHKVWFNGTLAIEDEHYRNDSYPDRHTAALSIQQGWNRLLIKSCVTNQPWNLSIRLTAMDGLSPLHVAWSKEPLSAQTADGIGTGPAPAPLAVIPPASLLSQLEARYKTTVLSREASAETTFEHAHALAQLLVATGADDAGEEQAKAAATLACETETRQKALRLKACMLASDLSRERGEKMRFYDIAKSLNVSTPELTLHHARLTLGSVYPYPALQILESIPAGSVEWMEAQWMRIRYLLDQNMNRTAHQAFDAVYRHAANSWRWTDRKLSLLESLNLSDQAFVLKENILAARPAQHSIRRQLIESALLHLQTSKAQELLAEHQRLAPRSVSNALYAASVEEDQGHTEAAITHYRRAIQLAPDDADLHATLGRALLRARQNDAARQALHQALTLKPQDTNIRELLEHISPSGPRDDEAWAVTKETLMARAAQKHSEEYPVEILQDSTVTTVFESGLSSKYRQVGIHILNEEGARQARTYPIQYDPETQNIEIKMARVHRGRETLESTESFEQPMGEPWYRIYYDTVARVLVFSSLKPGDVIEIRYRINDVTERNRFNDYFGDVSHFQQSYFVHAMEQVLITPESKRLFIHRSNGIEHEEKTANQKRFQRFFRSSVLPLVTEDGMPGAAEVVPYLHISTYESWQAMGKWYWALIQDQLRLDDELKRKIAEIIVGARTTEEKVKKIYRWVIEHTRYVGLEFGIHGFKPYKVTQIVQRGFGDCKDKASLIYAMLKEAGIDAHIVLTRTARNGNINHNPASLAVFDHAIAYVPELDLYLDGTAEFAGIRDLPEMDQGVQVLHVWPTGAELKTTPYPVDHARRTRTLNIQLNTQGSAVVQAEEIIQGDQALGYRKELEADGTREDRMTKYASSLFPGAILLEHQTNDLTDYETPVRLMYTFNAPQFAQPRDRGLVFSPATLSNLSFLTRLRERKLPLLLGAHFKYEETRHVTLPEGYRVTFTPRDDSARSAFGEYSIRYNFDAASRTMRIAFMLRLTEARIQPRDYPAFRAWISTIDGKLRENVIVTP